ncbi:MAG TPA: hypothetical protein VFZ98_01115 [Vicinamibacterales bacterium]
MRTIFAVASVITLLASQQSADRVQALTFRFQNNFWVNLHHLVRGEARRASLKLPLVVPLESLQPDERAAWSNALTAYKDLATKNLIFDRHLVAIDNALAGLATSDVPAGLVDEPIRRALNLAAPVYRLHGWIEQQHTNDAWITTLRPQVERHGAAMAAALAAAYHASWLPGPIVVDACEEAGPNDAYTTAGPPGTAGHTVVAVRSPANTGDAGVETIFHEASHTIDDRIARPFVEEAARQHLAFPDGLDHAILFYTTGEIMRREFARTGRPDYVPYGDRFDVYKNGWQTFRDALGRDWLPYLEGKAQFDAAVTAVVRDTAR